MEFLSYAQPRGVPVLTGSWQSPIASVWVSEDSSPHCLYLPAHRMGLLALEDELKAWSNFTIDYCLSCKKRLDF